MEGMGHVDIEGLEELADLVKLISQVFAFDELQGTGYLFKSVA